jgi:hypothetical protein
MAIHAVLTGDIVNSTLLDKKRERQMTSRVQRVLSPFKFEFYRGDSFQVYIKEPKGALRVALQCRTAAISTNRNNPTIESDIRISIGIGRVISPIKSLGKAKGEAFILSGRAFDEMLKSGSKLSINTNHVIANEGFKVLADYINAIFKEMTGKQAEVIFELLKGETQLAVAKKLKKSRSTVNQFVSSGRWPEIERSLTQYENIINLLS